MSSVPYPEMPSKEVREKLKEELKKENQPPSSGHRTAFPKDSFFNKERKWPMMLGGTILSVLILILICLVMLIRSKSASVTLVCVCYP